MANWYKWDSIESFNTWHDTIKAELGLPKPSFTEDGLEVPNGIITDQYTNAFIVAEDDIRAMVEDDYSEGLTASENPIIDERISS